MWPLLALLLAAGPVGGAVEVAATGLAARAVPEGDDVQSVALTVVAPGAEGLRGAVETALVQALEARGRMVLVRPPGDDRDGEAIAPGVDALLRVRAAIDGATLTLTAELTPLRRNFFLQRLPFRPAGTHLVTSSAPVDELALGLARARPAAGPIGLRALGSVPGRVLALAAGTTSAAGSPPRVVAVTATDAYLLDARGDLLDTLPLPPPPTGPRVRDPAATVVLGDFGAARIACALAGRPGALLLSAEGDRLAIAGALPATAGTVPLAAGGAGTLHGAFTTGRGTLLDALTLRPDDPAPARSARSLTAVSAAPRPGLSAFAVLREDGELELLTSTLGRAFPPIPGNGAGFALADLEGDGEPELVTSSPLHGDRDTVRVLRPGAPPRLLLEAPGIPGSILAGAAADLTGDGLDDALLAAVTPTDTQLWLVTADAGRAGR